MSASHYHFENYNISHDEDLTALNQFFNSFQELRRSFNLDTPWKDFEEYKRDLTFLYRHLNSQLRSECSALTLGVAMPYLITKKPNTSINEKEIEKFIDFNLNDLMRVYVSALITVEIQKNGLIDSLEFFHVIMTLCQALSNKDGMQNPYHNKKIYHEVSKLLMLDDTKPYGINGSYIKSILTTEEISEQTLQTILDSSIFLYDKEKDVLQFKDSNFWCWCDFQLGHLDELIKTNEDMNKLVFSVKRDIKQNASPYHIPYIENPPIIEFNGERITDTEFYNRFFIICFDEIKLNNADESLQKTLQVFKEKYRNLKNDSKLTFIGENALLDTKKTQLSCTSHIKFLPPFGYKQFSKLQADNKIIATTEIYEPMRYIIPGFNETNIKIGIMEFLARINEPPTTAISAHADSSTSSTGKIMKAVTEEFLYEKSGLSVNNNTTDKLEAGSSSASFKISPKTVTTFSRSTCETRTNDQIKAFLEECLGEIKQKVKMK